MPTTTLRRVCPLLERETSTEILPYAPRPWILRRCTESGFVFLENPPAYESFSEDYAWEVTSTQESRARKSAEPLRYAISTGFKKFRGRVLKRNKIRDLAHIVLENIDSDQVQLLDVGCGWGGTLEDIISILGQDKRLHCVPHGIELSRELAQISNERLRLRGGGCIHDTALNGLASFPRDYFSLIIMSSFLEHEINPLPLLRECNLRLQIGGHVVLKVPNFACFNRFARGARWCGFRWPDHVNYFTPHTLREMTSRAGLTVKRMSLLDRHPFSDNMYAVLVKSGSTNLNDH